MENILEGKLLGLSPGIIVRDLWAQGVGYSPKQYSVALAMLLGGGNHLGPHILKETHQLQASSAYP